MSLEVIGMSKSFGRFRALDDVSIRVRAGEFHALLGENGAGKSTLVKCLMGFHRADEGEVLLDGREVAIANPRKAQAYGLGMVYQHFTLVPSLTGAENLVVARAATPAVIDWREENRRLDAFMQRMPFRIALDRKVAALSSGERQKLEILKLLYLKQRLLILDEPTSVLTPGEADEILGLLRRMTEQGEISILMITHKFREVTAFADSMTVLRRGSLAGGGRVGDLTHADMASMMMGESKQRLPAQRTPRTGGGVRLELDGLFAEDDDGQQALRGVSLKVGVGEIVGVAGISGNGQSALVEAVSGQRWLSDGQMRIDGQEFSPSRSSFERFHVGCIPEDPLRNAAVQRMSVVDNIALRSFDKPPSAYRGWWLDRKAMREKSVALMARYNVKAATPEAPIRTLSGGNVQRAILARELSREAKILIVANPCFGLDFTAAAEIRRQLVEARNRGAAILLVSEDLDEILEIADRILVMSEGRITYVTPVAEADRNILGLYMAGAANP